MLPTLTICIVLATVGPADPPLPSNQEVLAVYRDLAARAGRDADAQVRLALWCDARGLAAERIKHLALAVLVNPNHATARGLLGMASYAGKWRSIQTVSQQIQSDEGLVTTLAEYNARRQKMAETAEAHWQLALWCEKKGLQPEAKAHLTAVTRLDPSRERAWTHLGCRKYNGRWMTPGQIAEEKAEAAAQRQADLHWSRRLESLRRTLATLGSRSGAKQTLAEVTDPRAARAIWAVFARGGVADQRIAVQLLGQIEGPEASLDLATLAVYSNAPEIRLSATEALVGRDPREVVGKLIELVRSALKYEVRYVGGPGSPGVLFVEGDRFNIRRIYEAPLPPRLSDNRIDLDRQSSDLDPVPTPSRKILPVVFPAPVSHAEVHHEVHHNDPAPPAPAHHESNAHAGSSPTPYTGTPAMNPGFVPHHYVIGTDTPSASSSPSDDRPKERVEVTREVDRAATIERQWQEARRAAASAQEHLQADIAAVRAYNQWVTASNAWVLPVLRAMTGRDFGDAREAWSKWWIDERGYAYTPEVKPTFVQDVPPLYLPDFSIIRVSNSCFGGGTPVQTLAGPRAIESLKVGDRVWTQDTKTGVLSFQSILTVYHNPPAPTLKIDLGGDAIIATPIHRFWRAGKGWAMARELKPGDVIRTLGGTARVVAVTKNPVQPVFNLEVAEGHTFFVGDRAVLAHDNSLVRPLHQPFDAAPEIATKPQARHPGRSI